MFLQNVYNGVTSQLGNVLLKSKSVAPEAMLVGGIAAGIASVVMVARGHKKAAPVVEDLKEDLHAVDLYFEEYAEEDTGEPVTTREIAETKGRVLGRAGVELVKLYGPGILMGAGSIMLILGSHGMMKKRAQALIGVATLLETSFSKYRARVRDEFGEDADNRLFTGAESRPVTVLQEEDGKKTKKKTAKDFLPEKADPLMYSRIFDETNRNWDPDPDLNIYGLLAEQRHMHDILQLRGHLVLNEVYRALGFPETDYGAVVGWLRNGDGDGFVDFGLDDDINKREGDNRWHLNFNVDGVIWDLIGRR